MTKPHVAPAVASLREALSAQGWLTEIFVPPAESANTEYSPDGSAQASSPIEPPPDMVVADAEDDPEYDANEDPSLAQQDY